MANYCVDHPDAVIDLSISEVAKASGVSIASVSRLAITLGFKDWKEFRLNFARGVTRPDDEEIFPDITPDDDDEMVARKVFENHVLSIRETFDQIDKADLFRVVDALVKADKVVFFGSGGSGYAARDEALRFTHLEISASAHNEEFEMMLHAARIQKGQVAFGFSNSGRSRATVGVLREARRNGALTVGIANYHGTPLEEVSDVFFCTSFPKRGGYTASLTARIAVSAIMDAIYVLCAHRGRIVSNICDVDRALESVRLAPKKLP
ncbi:MAG: MurR/RpiR family transcriptional regulator [Planctomycetaceae bacterium]|nr:MurR/RpiR family transcriptional regulator [Planctomycetaceae bacterium]